MANRETYPAALSPLQGDVSAGAGARVVTVTGLQTIPISATAPLDQQLLRYDLLTNQWLPSLDTNSAIYVDGVPVSDDYDVFVDAGPPFTVDGV